MPEIRVMTNTDDPKALITEAMRLRDAGNAKAAIPQVKAALERHPDHPRLWHTLGLLHRAEEDSAAAIAAFDRAVLSYQPD